MKAMELCELSKNTLTEKRPRSITILFASEHSYSLETMLKSEKPELNNFYISSVQYATRIWHHNTCGCSQNWKKI